MLQLSIINPHTILSTFARLNFFYSKCPFLGDFFSFHLLEKKKKQKKFAFKFSTKLRILKTTHK